jgi:hypothetical protein
VSTPAAPLWVQEVRDAVATWPTLPEVVRGELAALLDLSADPAESLARHCLSPALLSESNQSSTVGNRAEMNPEQPPEVTIP